MRDWFTGGTRFISKALSAETSGLPVSVDPLDRAWSSPVF